MSAEEPAKEPAKDKDIDTGTDHLLAELEAGVLTLTLNRPEVRNALSGEMVPALVSELAAAERNPEVRAIVVTGAGRGFCAGGDVKGMANRSAATGEALDKDSRIHRQRLEQRGISGRLFEMPKPTLACIPGAAAGAGMAIALACDLRIMAAHAIMTTAFAKVGFPGDYGGTFLATQIVGPSKARELFFLSERIDAGEALRLGLTNWVCEAEDLQARTREIAERLAAGPPIAYRYMKENLNRAVGSSDIGECMDLEATHQARCRETEDHIGAVKAFAERATPVFRGR